MSSKVSGQPPRKGILQHFWARIMSAGDVCGKLLTLVALPSAIAAVYAFYDQIGDAFSAPTVSAQVENVGLRCALALDVVPADKDPSAFADKKCQESPLSAWVSLMLENKDSIDRTIVAVAFRVSFPKKLGIADKPLIWTQARIVDHVLQNDFHVVQRSPWRPMLLAAGQLQPVEIDFRPFAAENQRPFSLFRDAILAKPSPLADTEIPAEVLGRFSGSEDWAKLGECDIQISAQSVQRKSKAKTIRALTRRCRPAE